MSVKCANCGLVSFAENQECRRCGMPLGPAGPGAWHQEPVNPGSVVDAAPFYGGSAASGSGPQDWNSNPQSWPPPSDGQHGNAGYGNGGYGGGYGSQAYGGTQGTYSPPYGQYGQYGGYAPSFGYAGYAMPQHEMADRGIRLVAAIIDSLCLYAPFLAAVFLGVMAGEAGIIVGVILGLLGMLGVFITQVVMLCQRGQTIGKRALGIRIVKIDTGENGGGVTNVILRGLVPSLIGFVPYIGPLFSLVNVCFIFAADRRCVHDHIASTIVVRGDP